MRHGDRDAVGSRGPSSRVLVMEDDHARSTQDTLAARLAVAAPGGRGLHSMGHGWSLDAGDQPHDDPRNSPGAPRLPGLAAHHPLLQPAVPGLAHPQRLADPHGPPPAVRERPLHTRHGVAPAHADPGAQGPRLDGERRLPPSLSLDRLARLPAHGRYGAALA